MGSKKATRDCRSISQVTRHLSSTPIEKLLPIAPKLASVLTQSREDFAAAEGVDGAGHDANAAFLVNKLKTQLTALLQGGTSEARCTAIILIKACIETGGRLILPTVLPWVKGLISILGKQESDQIKSICIFTLTRIFQLTRTDPALIREITTPALPGFISSCLNVARNATVRGRRAGSTALSTILQCFAILIPFHPSSFRPYVSHIRALILPLLSQTSSEVLRGERTFFPSPSVSLNARKLFVSLSSCAPKNGANDDRTKVLIQVIRLAHESADKCLWPVHEDSDSTARDRAYKDLDRNEFPEALNLPSCSGVEASLERLAGLVQTVGTFLSMPSNTPWTIPLGAINALLQRVLQVLPPSDKQAVHLNPRSTLEEREALFVGLQELHIAAIKTASALLSRLKRSSAAFAFPLLAAAIAIMKTTPTVPGLREELYSFVTQILNSYGPSLPMGLSRDLSECAGLCARDILPFTPEGQVPRTVAIEFAAIRSESLRAPKRSREDEGKHLMVFQGQPASHKTLQVAATKLLQVMVMQIPTKLLTTSVRGLIDRTAILSQNKPLMLVCATNPSESAKSSTLPFLVRSFPGHREIDLLVRPQMPLAQSLKHDESLDTTDTRSDSEVAESSRENDEIHQVPSPQISIDLNHDARKKQLDSEHKQTKKVERNIRLSDELPEPHPSKRQKVPRNEMPLPEDAKERLDVAQKETEELPAQIEPGHAASLLTSHEAGVRVGRSARSDLTTGSSTQVVEDEVAGYRSQATTHPPSGGMDVVDGSGQVDSDSESDFEMPVLEMDSEIEEDPEEESGND